MGHWVGASNSDWVWVVAKEGSLKKITYELNCQGQGRVNQPAKEKKGRGESSQTE